MTSGNKLRVARFAPWEMLLLGPFRDLCATSALKSSVVLQNSVPQMVLLDSEATWLVLPMILSLYLTTWGSGFLTLHPLLVLNHYTPEGIGRLKLVFY